MTRFQIRPEAPGDEEDKNIVGHVLFSEVSLDEGRNGLYALAPVAVLPEFQGKDAGRR